ncbi:hypothetical protein GCM10023215_65690 [Pseudonocardia yuanmonensis]|uniref:Uncharacterized protein n=1 Tax=Pseudonocardia yuanmonensis TaxID=1095914 RepID=A0ABP8XU39_9PSEU
MSRRELDALVERLSTAAADAARGARAVRTSWWDARGTEFAERLALVGRELERQAEAVAGLARGLAAPVDAAGPVLPGTSGRRAGETRGVRLPLLDDRREPGPP